jgi:hypothetical protein
MRTLPAHSVARTNLPVPAPLPYGDHRRPARDEINELHEIEITCTGEPPVIA